MIVRPLPSRLMGCLVLLAALSLSFGAADRILSRHTRAMMIDMRGFPDTEPFVCKGAGFQRNETDCTQFFRCVDFNNNGKHTIFRFMCGPMAVFDESRSLCTGPELSVPPCPKDQLDAFFVMMKPMDPGPPAPPIQPVPTTARPTTARPTTARPTTTTAFSPIPIVSSTEAPVPTPTPVTIPSTSPAPTLALVTTLPPTAAPPVTVPTTTTTSAPVVTVPSVTPAPVTVPPVTIPVPITTAAPEIVATTMTSAPVILTEPPTTPSPITVPVPPVTTPVPITTSAPVVTVPLVTPAPVTVPVPPVTIPVPVTTVAPEIVTISVTEAPQPTITSTSVPVTVPVTVPTVEPEVVPPTQPTAISTLAPITVPVPPVTTLVPITTAAPEIIVTTTTSAPVILTEPPTTPSPITVSVPPVTTPVPITTAAPEIIATTTTSAPVILTEAPTTPSPITVPVVTTQAPAAEIITTTVAAPVVTEVPATTTSEATPVPTITTTTEAFIVITSPIPTVSSTEAPVTVPLLVSTDAPATVPPPVIITTSSPVTVTTPAPIVIDDDTIKGFISIGNKEVIQNVQQIISTITVIPGITWAVVSQGEGSRIIIKEDGTSETTFSVIPPGSILMINTTQTGGVWNNVANGIFTTNSTTTSFPPGTTFSIVKVGANGQVISWQTILTTTSSSVLSVPTNSFLGPVQFVNKKVVTIAGWTFTTTYFTTGTTISSFGVLQPSTTTTSTSSQTTITTTSTVITGDQQFISGIITVGFQSETSPTTKDLSISGGDLLAIVPQGGQGIVTLIEEGSTSSTDFPVTPGSFLAVLAPSNGIGVVTNVVQSMFTSSTTTITFPAGSTVSILKVGINGQLIRISFVQLNSSFTLFTTVQSIVGIVQTTNTGVISNIGTGSFTTQLLTGSTKPVYFGVVNVNPIISTTTQVESLSGIIQIADATFLNNQQSTATVQTIQILPDTTSAILVSGEIKITEEDGTSIKQTAVSIPSGGILGIVTLKNGGEISGISNGYFTTTSTQIIFPFGTRFGIVIIRADGTMSLQNPIDTSIKTTITVPVGSIYGVLTLSSTGVVTGIGSALFSTQYLLLSDSTGPNVPATLGNFGVVYFSEQFVLSQSTVINSAAVSQQLETISAIVQIGVKGRFDAITPLPVAAGSSFAIIPTTGQGVVSVIEGGATSTFTVLPGQLFVVFNVQDGTVTDIGDGFFTTTTSAFTFGTGSQYGIIKIGLQGQIILTEFTRTAQNVFTVVVTPGSTVGTIQQTTDSRNIITSIGGANFAIKIMNTVNSLASTSELTSHAAILDIGSFTLPTTTSVPATVATVPVTTPAPITSAPSTESNINSIQTSQVESLFGILQIGDGTFLNRQGTAGETIQIAAQSTSAIIASGDIKVTEETETSSTQTTFSIPSGGIFSMVASTSGGSISGIANGYFTTNQTKITFQTGATIGIMIIRQDGTMSVQNPIATKVKTTITVPVGSTYGLVVLSAQNVVTGIGSTSFTTQNLLISDSTGANVPAVLGNFGVMFFNEQFQLSKSVVITSAQVSTQLKTISSIIQIGVKKQFASVSDVSVSSGSSFSILPAKGQGVVTINEGGSTSTFTILPGQMFGLLNAQGALVTQIGDGFFTTSTTSMSFGAGTTYGVVKIGLDGKMITTEFSRTAQSSFTVTVDSGSTAGIIQTESRGVITSIGGASFVIRILTSTSDSNSGSGGSVGILYISGFVPSTTTLRPPASTPQPPSAGPFTIDCALNKLHQFPLDCSRFYQCFGEDGDRTVYIFPCAPGLIFDESTSQCLTPAEAVCDDQTSINDTAANASVGGFFQINCSGDLFRYPLNCNNFYQCFKNEEGQETIYVFSCAAGLVFDETSRTCLLSSETSSCAVNDNLFRSPSIVFQLKQKIDIVSLISTSRTIVQQKSLTSSSTKISEISFSQPHETGRGSTKRKMGYAGETADRQVGQRRINTEIRKAKESKLTVPVVDNFRPRTFDSSVYGVRIGPLSKSLFGQSKTN